MLTGEGAFDFQSRDGKVIAGVAKVANDAMRPCVVLAGKVQIGSREMRTMGVESAYSLVDAVGEERRSPTRTARWPPSPSGSPRPGRAERPGPAYRSRARGEGC